MTILFQDYYDVDGDLSTLGPAVGGAYALLWSDVDPNHLLTDFDVEDADGGLRAPSTVPSGIPPASVVVCPMGDVVGNSFSIEMQFIIETLVADLDTMVAEITLFESADIAAFDHGLTFPAITMQVITKADLSNTTVSAYNCSSAGDLVVFCTQDGAGEGPVFHPTGSLQILRLEVTPTEVVFLLDGVVIGRRAAVVSELLDTVYINLQTSDPTRRLVHIRQLQVGTGTGTGLFWTDRVRTAEVAA